MRIGIQLLVRVHLSRCTNNFLVLHSDNRKNLTRKRAIAKALKLEGHPDFAPVDLAYYQHFLGVFVRKHCVLGSSAWQPQMQITWSHAPCQRQISNKFAQISQSICVVSYLQCDLEIFPCNFLATPRTLSLIHI